MKVAIGSIILLFGLINFGVAVSDTPPNVSVQYLLGYFLVPGAIIILGIVILTWKKRAG